MEQQNDVFRLRGCCAKTLERHYSLVVAGDTCSGDGNTICFLLQYRSRERVDVGLINDGFKMNSTITDGAREV